MTGHRSPVWYSRTMTAKIIGLRTLSAFVLAATSNIGLGALIDVAVWKSAAMAGVAAVLTILNKLARAYKDGQLTAEEIESAFN